MSTVFIAVQCFQCSTMQVKQKKKSSNKWNCVVCNEKQSVRKVFSQGFMAKDVRKFVQSFNMSRQFVEQQEELREQTLVQQQTQNQSNKKRTDWSEYIDPDMNDFEIGDDEGDLCEPNVVTELPKPLFKKPKLRNTYSAAAGFDCENGGKLVRRKKKVDDPDTISTSVMLSVSKWNNFIDDDDNADGCRIGNSKCEEISHAAFQTKVSDEIVEDDVHPDFI